METTITFILFAAVLVIASMAGALLPRIRQLSHAQTGLLVSLSSGIFIGLLFIMLLPEAIHQSEHTGMDIHDVMYAIMAGFVLILVVNVILKKENGAGKHCHHHITSMSTLIGLSVHAACDGMALAATFMAGEEIGLMATIGMCIHKFVVLFSLSSCMLISEMDRRTAMKYLFGFSLITPLAGVVFMLLLNGIHIGDYTALPLAFAAGTFMYVSLCDLLPEAFHDKERKWQSLAMIIVGMAIIAVVMAMFPHSH